MHRARARDPARQDLAAFRHERAQQFHILVVNVVNLIGAELTHFAAPEHRPALPLLFLAALFVAAASATAARSSLSKWHATPPRRRNGRRPYRRFLLRSGPRPA